MNIKKLISIVLFFIMIFLFSGCSNEKIEVSIISERNGWSPAMSSQPGIPLRAEFKTMIEDENVQYHWVTEEGTFLTWQESKIELLGKDIITNEQKLYWSLDPTEKLVDSSFKIYLLIEDNSSKVIAETSIQIEEKEGFFSIKY